jgi:transposase
VAREEGLQSALDTRAKSFQVIDAELTVLDASPATPRRRWSGAAKSRILAEALEPDVNVSAVARRHGLKPQQLFGWRRQALRSGVIRAEVPRSDGPTFVPVEAPKLGVPVCRCLEVVVGDVTLRTGPDVSPARLAELIRAVRQA